MKTLNEIESFGGIDADADSLLDECFQDHQAYLEALSHRRTLILGRKGSGKTAIFRKIVRTRRHDFFSFGHTFSDYPWNHHHLQSVIGVPDESKYVQSWQYLILMTAAKILLNQDHSQPWSDRAMDELGRIEKFVVDSYGTRDPDVTQIFTPAKRLRITPTIKVAKGWAEGGLDMERLPVTDLPKVVQEVNVNVATAIVECLNPSFDYFICFDELDRGFDPKSEDYKQMLTGLILAAKILNEKARAAGKKFSVVIFLRDDIYEVLRFEDKNKITVNSSSAIEWDSDDGRWPLRGLMERRFSSLLGEGENVLWASVFNETQEMPGRQTKYQHILDRTFKRPRDIIKFCNEVLEAYKRREIKTQTVFENTELISARPNYSDYLLRELDDEIFKHISEYETYLDVLRNIGKQQFNITEFEEACKTKKASLSSEIDPRNILKALFEFSVVAYQKTGGVGGGSEYVWRYRESRARYDESAQNFRVHPGLLEAVGLKKFTVRRS